jgi:WD40 repeat protein
MALANIAFILAGNGFRVLVIDWDLEAPGLHRYFHPFLKDKELTTSEGVIDFVVNYATSAVSSSGGPDDWYVPYGNILRYASSLDFRFPSGGVIDFVPAGRQGADYAAKVNSFNWQHFYEELDGGIFLEFSKKSMTGYHFVLIDSRTGVSDTSGICTVQMPDKLVVCFTPNSQSIEGAAAVAESAYHQRIRPDGAPGLQIFPVLTRVERGEQERIQIARELARLRFDDLLSHMKPAARDEYWSRIAISHEPYYAFEEVLACFAEKPEQTTSMLGVMKLLSDYIVAKELGFPDIDEVLREKVLDQFARRTKRQVVRVLSAGVGSVTDVGLSDDVVRAVSGHSNGVAVVWDVESGRALRRVPAQRTRKIAVAVSGDGRRVAVGGRGFSVTDIESGEMLANLAGIEDIASISLSPDGRLALCCFDDKVCLFDLAAHQRLRVFSGHRDWVRSVALSGDGQRAISAGDDKTVILWDLQTGGALRRLEGHTGWIWSVALSYNARVALSGSDDCSAIVWDLDSGKPRYKWTAHKGRVRAVSLNRDGKHAITGGEDGRILFWDVESGQPLRSLDAQAAAVTALRLSAGGRRAAGGGADGNIRVWDTEAGEAVAAKRDWVQEFEPAGAEPPPEPAPEALPVTPPRAGAITPVYWAFASYAQPDWEGTLSKFFNDLSSELSLLGGEKPLFVRQAEGIAASLATEEHALKTSRILLAVLSPSYLRSEHNCREFGAFLQDPSRRVVPLIWVPLPGVNLKPMEIQNDVTRLPNVFYQEGLRYIMRLRRYREVYLEIVQVIAGRVAGMVNSQPPMLNVLPPLDQVQNPFIVRDEPARQDASVRFDCLAPTRQEAAANGLDAEDYGDTEWDGTPFGGHTARLMCQTGAGQLAVRFTTTPLSGEDWRDSKFPTIVLLDPKGERIPRLRLMWRALANSTSYNLEIVCAGAPPPNLAKDSVVLSGTDEVSLATAITRAITDVRLRIISTAAADRQNVGSSSGSLPQLSPREGRR